MKVVEFINAANKKTSVKVDRLMDMKRFYLSMHRVHMVYLYDKGYINDPTKFDEKQIYSNIVDMRIKGMISMSGEIILTSNHIRYAAYKNRDDESVHEFLSILYNVMKYYELSREVDSIYEEFKFYEDVKQKVGPNLILKSSRVISKSAYTVGRATMACLLKNGNTVSCEYINGFMWDIAMRELGIPEEDWHKDGLFDSSLSHDEEVECMSILLEGIVDLSGKYADVLTDWMFQHKWLEKGMSIDKKGLFSYVYVAYTSEVLEGIEKALDELIDRGKSVIGIIENTIYYEDTIKEYNIPIGCFSVQAGYEDSVMYEGNCIIGYTGEAYPVDYVLEENVPFVGCPVELNTSCKNKGIYFDLEQVAVSSDTWFKSEKVEIDFEENSDNDDENPFKEGSLEHKIHSMYKNSFKGNLLGKLEGSYSISDIESAIKKVMSKI